VLLEDDDATDQRDLRRILRALSAENDLYLPEGSVGGNGSCNSYG
jgi:hypothetical protein